MKKYPLLLLSILGFTFCKTPAVQIQSELPDQRDKITERATDWDKLFYKTTGWFGGDGIFVVPLNGKEYVPASAKDSTMFLFSDSLIKKKGAIKNRQIKGSEYKMIHNSVGYMVGRNPENDIDYYWKKDRSGMPKSVFKPTGPNRQKEDYFWLGDGFVNTAHDSTLYVFAYPVRDVETDGFFPFVQLGVTIIAIEKGDRFPFESARQIETELVYKVEGMYGETTFGNSILVNTKEAGAPHPDGYIYIYGVMGIHKELIVARVLPADFENLARWTFWDGETWNSDKTQVASVTKNTANELSMQPLANGQFLLVTQESGIRPYVNIVPAKSPVGPFYPSKKIWYCEETDLDKDYFAYNAKAHPHISPDGKLLISYNLNSFDFFVDILNEAHDYRPRFILMDLK